MYVKGLLIFFPISSTKRFVKTLVKVYHAKIQKYDIFLCVRMNDVYDKRARSASSLTPIIQNLKKKSTCVCIRMYV